MTNSTPQEPGIIEHQFKGTVLENGYGLISREVMFDEKLSAPAKSVYALFVSMVGTKEYAWPSVDFILQKLQISRNSFFKYIKELKQHGFINTVQQRDENNKFQTTHYFVILADSEVAKLKVYNSMTDQERSELAKRDKLIEQLAGMTTSELEAMVSLKPDNDIITPCTKICDTEPCTKICDTGRVPNFGIPKNGTQIIEDQIITSNKELIITKENGAGPATPTPPAEPDDEIRQVDFSQLPTEAITLAQKLAMTIRANHPYKPDRECPQPTVEPANVQLWNWAKEINMINYLGPFLTKKTETDKGIPWAVIEEAIDYLTKKPHWKNKVISGLELRKCISAIIGDITEEKEIAMRRKKPYAGRNQTTGGQPNNKPIPATSKFEPFDDEGFYCQYPDESTKEMLLRIDADPRCNEEKFAYFRDALDKGKLRIS